LRETIEGELDTLYFYHYPRSKAEERLAFEKNWKKVAERFRSATPEAIAAVDCWAMGHGTACVFHLMRLVEHGLRAIARERRVKLHANRPLEWAEWQKIIKAIEDKANKIYSHKPGKARDAALEFYRGLLGEIMAFKDVYRNNVMHTRKSYDVDEAKSVMNHVHGFMSRLSEKIGEDQQKQISWGRMS
jgi:hypothetical protein